MYERRKCCDMFTGGNLSMNPLNHLNPIERDICNRADLAQIPIAGNFELLPLCNMDCKMCFAKMTKDEMNKHSPMHDYKEWLNIAKNMSDAGMIFLLLTGGEPFLYPHFKELYLGLKKMGIIVSINTNGTLINEEIADYLASDPPRRLNITLYGSNDETYAKLCHNPKGFTQVMNAVKILKERNIAIKFNCSLTPDNINEQEAIFNISKKLDIPIEMGFYMFPPIRKNNIQNVKYRLSATEAAKARFTYEKLKRSPGEFNEFVSFSLKSYNKYQQQEEFKSGYTCRSGNSVFWVNYDGTMSACSFTNDFTINIFENDFKESWNKLVNHVSSSKMSLKCHKCKERILCGRCAAAAITETGKINGVPDYYCKITNHYIKLLKEYERTNINENK